MCATTTQTSPGVTPEKNRLSTAVTESARDTEAAANGKSVSEDKESLPSSKKRKERNSHDPTDNQAKKNKDEMKPSPQKTVAAQGAGKKEGNDWQNVRSRKDKRNQAKEQFPKQPAYNPRPEPKRKKQREWTRPNAVIIRPTEKEKYSDILRRIKEDIHDDKIRSSVEKIFKTKSGDMLITISRENTDKGQELQKAIAGILKEDAQVICKGPQKTIEILDVDNVTTKDDIQAALLEITGETCDIPLESIKIRNAYRGTQTATVTLPAVTAQKLLEGNGKIRIGLVNCRMREIKRPIRCYKCWNFGHFGYQCKSSVDRSKLCIRCGQEGHRIAECKNPAKCALCTEEPSAKNVDHHAGTHRCPVYQEAFKKITEKRT